MRINLFVLFFNSKANFTAIFSSREGNKFHDIVLVFDYIVWFCFWSNVYMANFLVFVSHDLADASFNHLKQLIVSYSMRNT